MAKRIFAGYAILVICLASALPAHAQDTRDAGCAALAGTVTETLYDAITQSGAGGLLSQGLSWRRMPPPRTDNSSPQICGRTATAASRAFAKVMAGYNLSVSWHERGSLPASDYCLGGDLAQCYPQPNTAFPAAARNRALLLNAWQGVSAGIRQHMPYGSASDISYFFTSDLAATIAISLDATLDRPVTPRTAY